MDRALKIEGTLENLLRRVESKGPHYRRQFCPQRLLRRWFRSDWTLRFLTPKGNVAGSPTVKTVHANTPPRA